MVKDDGMDKVSEFTVLPSLFEPRIKRFISGAIFSVSAPHAWTLVKFSIFHMCQLPTDLINSLIDTM